MISASHNPCEFNGIKIFSGDGYKLPDALEEQIESIVLDHRAPYLMPEGGDIGRVSVAENAVKDYIADVKSREFPAEEHTFKIDDSVLDKLY